MHMSKEQLAEEHKLLVDAFTKIENKPIVIERSYGLREGQHHIPGYVIHGWIDGHLTKYLEEAYGVKNHFYELGLFLTFLLPMTKETLDDKTFIEYRLRHFQQYKNKPKTKSKWDAIVRGEGEKIFAITDKKHPLTLIGPQPEIFLSNEYERTKYGKNT